MKLLLSQKNQLFDTIEAHDLSPSQFEIKDSALNAFGNISPTNLNFINSEFYYLPA